MGNLDESTQRLINILVEHYNRYGLRLKVHYRKNQDSTDVVFGSEDLKDFDTKNPPPIQIILKSTKKPLVEPIVGSEDLKFYDPDVVQEAFTRAREFIYADKYDPSREPSPGNMLHWLRVIAKNSRNDIWKEEKKNRPRFKKITCDKCPHQKNDNTCSRSGMPCGKEAREIGHWNKGAGYCPKPERILVDLDDDLEETIPSDMFEISDKQYEQEERIRRENVIKMLERYKELILLVAGTPRLKRVERLVLIHSFSDAYHTVGMKETRWKRMKVDHRHTAKVIDEVKDDKHAQKIYERALKKIKEDPEFVAIYNDYRILNGWILFLP